jgi:clan AA aspartic protease (TIGR02281 family)
LLTLYFCAGNVLLLMLIVIPFTNKVGLFPLNNRFSLFFGTLLAASVGLNIYLYAQLALTGVLDVHQSANRPARPLAQVATGTVSENTTATTSASASKPNQIQLTTQFTVKQAERFFSALQFNEAVALYEELILLDEQAAIELKRRWYEQLKGWLSNQDYPPIEAFNQAFLSRFPYDLTFLALKADALAATDQVAEAIELYFLMISYTFETRQEEYFSARIRHLATEQLTQLKQSQQWQAMIDFSGQLLQQESSYPPYILAQAEAYIKVEDFDSAEPMLTALLDNKFYRDQTQSLLDDIRNETLQQTAIQLQPLGEHYIVDGFINQSSNIRLMIDTGASLSVLTRARFDELESWTNPLYMGETLLNTAGGQINAPIYQFERFQIGYFYVDNISFVILDLEDMVHYHGLLGMNFLKQFKFQIDQERKLLILSP